MVLLRENLPKNTKHPRIIPQKPSANQTLTNVNKIDFQKP